MGAIFEIEMLSEQYVGYDWIESIINVLGIKKIIASNVTAGNDWAFEKEEPCENAVDICACIENGKIIRVDLSNYDEINCGVFIYKDLEIYHYSIWSECIDSKMDKDIIDRGNKHIYNSLYAVFRKLICQGVLSHYVIIAMGVELYFEMNHQIVQTVKNAQNVCSWIVNPLYFDSISGHMTGYTLLRCDGFQGYIFEKS